MLKIKVKAGSITNLGDARYFAGMGVDLLGFPVGPLAGTLDPVSFKEITEWVSGPSFVMEWTGTTLSPDIAEVLAAYNVDFLEIDVSLLEEITPLNKKLIIRLQPADWDLYASFLRAAKDHISYLLFTQTNQLSDKNILAASKEFDVLLSCKPSLIELDQLIGLPNAGIALEGTRETKPGLNDYAGFSEILEHLEVSDE